MHFDFVLNRHFINKKQHNQNFPWGLLGFDLLRWIRTWTHRIRATLPVACVACWHTCPGILNIYGSEKSFDLLFSLCVGGWQDNLIFGIEFSHAWRMGFHWQYMVNVVQEMFSSKKPLPPTSSRAQIKGCHRTYASPFHPKPSWCLLWCALVNANEASSNGRVTTASSSSKVPRKWSLSFSCTGQDMTVTSTLISYLTPITYLSTPS